ncbi:hypothetical protein ABZ897_24530 [Nonomuraea sp. NPDC046802]|uniref:hypothetical protein n=1 Tax=Nonomuraea sp. NPDC046802 TaxID=3154919 RepID=UPI0033D4BEA6
MIVTHPLRLPAEVMAACGLKLLTTFQLRHLGVSFSASGDAYVLSSVRERDIRADTTVSGYLIARYRPDGTPVVALTAGLRKSSGLCDEELHSQIPDWLTDVCVLPGGGVAVSSEAGRTYLLDPDLTRLDGAWAGDADDRRDAAAHHARSFAAVIRATPSGRLLCLVPEYGARGYGRMEPNLFGTADGALTPRDRPQVRVFACLNGAPQYQDASHVIPYAEHMGAPAGHGNRPEPDLRTLTSGRWADVPRWTFTPWLGSPVVAADDLFVIPVFDPGARRSSPYVFALVDDTGVVRGRLEGLGQDDRSPYPGKHYAVAADPARGRIFHINRSGLHVWSIDGQPLVTLPADDKVFKPLTRFHLAGCSPAGELVLLHQSHHLLLRIGLPGDLDRLGPTVQTALAEHTRRRNQLKKELAPSNWIWTAPVDTVIV